MNVLLKADNLSYAFGEIPAVDGVSFGVDAGEIVGLLGPDGAGKTTVIRMLVGLLRPKSGTIDVCGHDPVERSHEAHDNIGYVPQRFGLAQDLTVDESIAFSAAVRSVPKSERRALVDRLREFVGLGQFGSRLAGALSGGMKQKLSLAAALVHRPPVLLLDEPTNGVDPVSRRDFWALLGRLAAEGTAVLVSTPYLDEAERCDRVAFMHLGRITASGTVDALRRAVGGGIAVLSVHARDAARSVDLLRNSGFKAISVGTAVRVHHSSAGEAMSAVKRLLEDSGVEVLGTRVEQPSLEELFVEAREVPRG